MRTTLDRCVGLGSGRISVFNWRKVVTCDLVFPVVYCGLYIYCVFLHQTYQVDLKPSGSDMVVTNENKKEYIE